MEHVGPCYLTDIVAQFPYVGLFALLLLGGIGLPFPEDATLILSGFLIAHDFVHGVPALITVFCGVMAADILLYAAGRRFGPRITGHLVFSRYLTGERLAYLESLFKRRGVALILVGRHLVGLRAQLFLVAGVMKMSPMLFVLADACASMVTIGIMVGAGYLGGDSLQIIRKDLSRIEHAAIVIAVAALGIFVLVRYFRARRHDRS